MRRWARRTLVALFGLWVVASLYSLRPTGHDPEPISYVLTWEWGDAEPTERGTWIVLTDLGYEVEVLEGRLTTYEATAIACPDDSSWWDGLFFLGEALAIQPAAAGHGESADETVVAPVVESLNAPEEQRLGSGWTTTSAYCEAHVAFGDTEPEATTLYLELLVDGSRHLVLETGLPWGVIGALEEEAAAADTAPAVEVVRDLGSMFDGIDFDTADPDELPTLVLRGLAAGTSFVAA